MNCTGAAGPKTVLYIEPSNVGAVAVAGAGAGAGVIVCSLTEFLAAIVAALSLARSVGCNICIGGALTKGTLLYTASKGSGVGNSLARPSDSGNADNF